MGDNTAVKGTKKINSGSTMYNALDFMMQTEILNNVNTAIPVTVTEVESSGADCATGYVTVRPLVSQLDGFCKAIDPADLYHLPYMRVQGGKCAVVADPIVGDIGLAVFSKYDCSNIQQGNTATVQPASFRRYSMSDGFYIGGFLNSSPETVIALNQDNTITVTATEGITVNAKNVTVSNGDIVANGISLVGHTHTGVHGETSAPNGGTGTAGSDSSGSTDVDLSDYYTKSETDEAIATAVDGVSVDLSAYSTTAEVNEAIETAVSEITDEKVKQEKTTTDASYPILTAYVANQSATATNKARFGVGVTVNPSTSTITATTFVGELSGNAATATRATTAETATNSYTKDETDAAINAAVANVTVDMSDYYTSAETDSAIATAVDGVTVDLSDYYTKTEVDALIPDVSGYQTATDVSDAIAATTYTKEEVRALIDSVNAGDIDLTNYYTIAETDAAINTAVEGLDTDRALTTTEIEIAWGENLQVIESEDDEGTAMTDEDVYNAFNEGMTN